MTSWLARLASYPRQRYVEDGHNLDIAFVTDTLWVMSLPSVTWPERLYRNNLQHVKALLDARAGTHYRIFDFRAEGAGYSDADFDGRVTHFPFIDHEPPPLALLLRIIAGLAAHLQQQEQQQAVAVIHCKAGKGRSGLGTCAYLVAQEGWREQDARALFTRVRMKPGFGEGLSIPSQQRYLRYVSHWCNQLAKQYVPQRIKVERVVVRGLKRGCQLSVRQFREDGRKIECVRLLESVEEHDGVTTFTPHDLYVEDDVCIYLAKGQAFAHFWFNAVLEAAMNPGTGHQEFEIAWEQVDGWKGTRWRGVKAYDSITVTWTADQK